MRSQRHHGQEGGSSQRHHRPDTGVSQTLMGRERQNQASVERGAVSDVAQTLPRSGQRLAEQGHEGNRAGALYREREANAAREMCL